MHSDPKHKTILITGCNRGLGFQLLKILISKNPDINVIATVRSQTDQFQKKLNSQFQGNKVKVMELDLSKKQSIDPFVNSLKNLNIKLYALVNNAAIMVEKIGVEDQILSVQQAKQTFQINYYGTINLTKQLISLLQDNGRVINVSSGYAALVEQGKSIQQIFRNPQITENIIETQINNYIEGCEKKELGQFFKHGYATSKMILNAWSRFILSKALKPSQTAIAMSPGHCRTDMGGPTGKRSAEEGALSIYELLWGEKSSQIFYHARGATDYETCTI